MTHPPPTLALYAPRLIRLVRGVISCPRCGKNCIHSILQSGRAFQSCRVQLSTHVERMHSRGRCEMEWWALALPPDCFGGWLAAVAGERDAAYLITRCWPSLATTLPPALWHTQLITGTEPAWIQVAVKSRERHLYRQAPIGELLHHLLRAA